MSDIFAYDPSSVGSKGLVYLGNDILVYRRDTKTDLFPLYIDLPGGGPEGKESPFGTFQREVREEFGLEISPERVVHSSAWPSSTQPGATGYFIVVKLPAEAAGDIVFGDEGLEYLIISPREFLTRTDVWPVMRERAQAYFESADA